MAEMSRPQKQDDAPYEIIMCQNSVHIRMDGSETSANYTEISVDAIVLKNT